MQNSENIFLIGPMGAGKSTVGRELARILKKDFYDTDQEIEKRCGASVSWIFDLEGEPGFRQREEQVLAELCQKKGIILATGGGAILSEKNRTYLKNYGTVIYLYINTEQQLERIAKDKQRPLLQCADREKKIKELALIRTPLYQQTADWSVDAGQKSVSLVVGEILKIKNKK